MFNGYGDASRPMSNPLRILTAIDRHLASPAEITLFGRSALALGYPDAPIHFHRTEDVDGILPIRWLEAPDWKSKVLQICKAIRHRQ